MIFSFLESVLTTSQQDEDYKDSLNELPFSSQRTWIKSHKCKLTCWPWADIQGSALPGSCLWHDKGYNSLTRLSQQNKTSGRNGEKMCSFTNRRCFRRHECPCKCPSRWGPRSSLPLKRWLPWDRWSQSGTPTCLVWAPSTPGRRGRRSPGRSLMPWPRWWLPLGRTPFNSFTSLSLLLLGLLDLVLLGLRGWLCTIVL